MNQASIERHLSEAEQHIKRGMEHIVGQHQIIADLRRDGQDTTQAEELLVVLNEAQHLHLATRERFLKELWSA